MGSSEGQSVSDTIGWPKSIMIGVLTAIAISAPTFTAKTGVFNHLEPAWFSLVVGVFVGLFAWGVLTLFMKSDLDKTSLASTVVVYGLIAAHVCVYEISDSLPRIPVYLLFGFVFYHHFTSLGMFNR